MTVMPFTTSTEPAVLEVTVRLTLPPLPALRGRMRAVVAHDGHVRRSLLALVNAASTSDGSLAQVSARYR